jgi:hypothetical protein
MRFHLPVTATFALMAAAMPAHAQSAQSEPASTQVAATTAELRTAWNGFYRAIDAARVQMEQTPRFAANPQDRAKAYHTLMEMQAMAYNFIIAPRRDHPRLFRNLGWQTDIYTLGQNGPDFDYRNLFVDGAGVYRLSGRIGSSSLTLIQTFNGVFGEDGVKTTGNFDLSDFKVEPDGRFEIILGGPKREGNWIPLDPKVDYQHIFVRRALTDWNADPGEMKVERISPVAEKQYDPDEFSEAEMAKRIRRATGFLHYLVNDWNVALYDCYLKNAGGKKNTLSLLPGTVTSQVGSPSSNYAMGIFHLEDDEALVVELPHKPSGAYWSFQLGDVWSRSLSFRDRQTSLNNAQTHIDRDGGVRVVISKRDPSVANWLDTAGRVEGTVVFRNYRATSAPVPSARKVKLSEVARFLPKDTLRIAPSERAAIVAKRQAGYDKVLGE